MPAPTDDSTTPPPEPQFSLFHQKISFDIDFAARTLIGKAEIDIRPHSKELRTIRLNCRQCSIERVAVEWRGESRAIQFSHQDPYTRLVLSSLSTVYSHELLRKKIDGQLREPPEEELVITLPKWLHIVEEDPSSVAVQEARLSTNGIGIKSDGIDGAPPVGTPTVATAYEPGTVFQPIKIHIDFVVKEFRDGLHFVGLQEDDTRYPHLYTRNSAFPGAACCLFPCLDNTSSRCPWDISIRCPRTLGDVFQPSKPPPANGVNGHLSGDGKLTVGAMHGIGQHDRTVDDCDSDVPLSDEERALDISVVCSGDMTDEIVDPKDPSRKTVSFFCATPVAARHIGFAVGPFEHVDLSEFRESDQDEKLGDKAIPVDGFCLPGRSEELRNTCMPLAMAIDRFTLDYGYYPFSNYKVCFVDDLVPDVASAASLSICSTRLLFPDNILEPLDSATRTLIHALACQWSGVYVTAQDPGDAWILVGGAYFMTDMFLGSLWGRNEFRFRQKIAADTLSELDVSRPSLYQLGAILTLHPGESEFMALKAPLVLSILHQRLIKASGRNGINRVFWRLFLNAKVDETQRSISTQGFLRICEKIGHQKLDAFFNQWVYGAGCPHFWVTQRFNKKKLVVEMSIRQMQADRVPEHKLEPDTFMQEVQEDKHNVWAETVQPLFTGPMTIRIHEADGTPYEHIIEIKEVLTKFEIPYNTKYKRLKRSRRQKERAAAAVGVDIAGDAQDDVLLYCLGDVLQTEEEVKDWRLTDWSKEDEEKMSQESYEWIRVDKDFEWVCKMSFGQPHYMFVSQLQQDNDVVAQVEAVQYLTTQQPFPIISTILVRTLMDRRYFYGVRILAANALVKCAKDELDWIGLFHLEKAFQEFFCFPDSPMTRSNDFYNRTAYLIQCAIPKAISKIRDSSGKAPMRVKQFFVDKLKFNDNSNNEYSDCHYVATLMSCLAESLVAKKENRGYDFSFEEDGEEEDDVFQRNAINEIERYRRIDEWVASYHNVYSVTALECLELLIRNKILPLKTADFVQYTRPGNADEVRLKAFSCLMELGSLKNPTILRYVFYSFAAEPSPYVRDRLWHIIGHGLGHIAIGTSKPHAQSQQNGGLIVEQEASTESRQAEIARTQTVPGALAALNDEIGQSEVFKQALRNALTSPVLSLREFTGILDVCGLFYEPNNRLWVSWKYPRYYKVEHMGQGKLKFSKTNKVRQKPIAPIQWPQPPPLRIKAPSPSLKRQRSESVINVDQPPKKQQQFAKPAPTPASNASQSTTFPRRTVLKIKSNKLAAFTQSQPSENPPASAAQPSPTVPNTQLSQPAHANGVNGTAAAMSPPAEGKMKIKIKFGAKPS